MKKGAFFGIFIIMVLAATSGMGLGAMNELIEFAATLLVPETNVGGYVNTGWDLVANFVGAVAAAAVIGWRGVSSAAIVEAGREEHAT